MRQEVEKETKEIQTQKVTKVPILRDDVARRPNDIQQREPKTNGRFRNIKLFRSEICNFK